MSSNSSSSDDDDEPASAYQCLAYQTPTTSSNQHQQQHEACIEQKQGFDFGTALENVYPLTDIITHYVPYRDLLTLAKLSEGWKDSCDKQCAKRRYAGQLIVYRSAEPRKENTIHLRGVKTKNFDYVPVSAAIVFYVCGEVELQQYVCWHRKTCSARKTLYEHILDDIVVTPNAPVACISVEAIPYGDSTIKSELCISALILPVIPNIRVECFYCFKQNKDAGFDSILGEGEMLEGVIVMTRTRQTQFMERLMRRMRNKQQQPIALAGGLMNGVKSTAPCRLFNRDDFFCIGFVSGGDGAERKYHFASVVIGHTSFRTHVQHFSERVEHREHSVIVNCRCYARPEATREDQILRDIFKTTQIVSVDLNGEIGVDLYEQSDLEPIEKKSKKTVKYYHDYSAILFYIAWGDIKH